MERDGFKFWYRNPDRPSQDSLGISYADGADTKIVRPDFIFFAEQGGEVVVDIIDPHGFHLADALPKLQGLARYAETHSQNYRRIEAVAETGGKLRVLNLTAPMSAKRLWRRRAPKLSTRARQQVITHKVGMRMHVTIATDLNCVFARATTR